MTVFSDDFIVTENTLCRRDDRDEPVMNEDGGMILECLCGLVLTGRTDVAQPCFTEGGSFWSNDLARETAGRDEVAGTSVRGRCLKEGYKSLALIPLRSGGGNRRPAAAELLRGRHVRSGPDLVFRKRGAHPGHCPEAEAGRGGRARKRGKAPHPFRDHGPGGCVPGGRRRDRFRELGGSADPGAQRGPVDGPHLHGPPVEGDPRGRFRFSRRYPPHDGGPPDRQGRTRRDHGRFQPRNSTHTGGSASTRSRASVPARIVPTRSTPPSPTSPTSSRPSSRPGTSSSFSTS